MRAFTAFKSAIEGDSRYVILAVCDMLKLVLGLAILASQEHISLWFYMVYSDGQLIYAFSKIRERLMVVNHSEETT